MAALSAATRSSRTSGVLAMDFWALASERAASEMLTASGWRATPVAVGAIPTTTGVARQPDAVSISDAARSVASAQKSVASTPDVREDRVATLKAAVANGSYSVNSRTLATSILSGTDVR